MPGAAARQQQVLENGETVTALLWLEPDVTPIITQIASKEENAELNREI